MLLKSLCVSVHAHVHMSQYACVLIGFLISLIQARIIQEEEPQLGKCPHQIACRASLLCIFSIHD